MKRRTLDILFAAGGFGIAVLLLVMGVVMTNNGSFAKHYVHDQLAQQHIAFKPAAALTTEEAARPCLVAFAGQQLTTGKQAECYANEFIGLHVKAIADGETYADLGTPQMTLSKQIAAMAPTDPALPALQAKLAGISAQRDTLFKGETLRGLLLTSFGFSVFGVKATQAAAVSFGAAALLALLSLAGLAHGLSTPKTVAFAETEKAPVARRPKHLAPAN